MNWTKRVLCWAWAFVTRRDAKVAKLLARESQSIGEFADPIGSGSIEF